MVHKSILTVLTQLKIQYSTASTGYELL